MTSNKQKANIGWFKEGNQLGLGNKYSLGRRVSKKTREKLSKANRGKYFGPKGEKHWNWKGGRTYMPDYNIKIRSAWRLGRAEKVAGRKKSELCEICNSDGVICFDHCHKTGKFRGWICRRCNVVLGFVEDDKELLKAILEYLNKY